ncbi:MAG: crotonase/enoyl-CoA hydratase family protein [Rhodoglobus sp.]
MTESECTVVVERSDRVTTMTLNRPEARNAFNAAQSTALGLAIEEFDNDPEQRVAIVTGSGQAFSAGMDLKAFVAGQSIEPDGHPEWGFAGFVQHFTSKPVIAAVNGFALGGGAELALACDLVVADENASFGFPEVQRGLFPAGGGVIRLAQLIPQRFALEMILTGQPIGAARALDWGLINRVAAAGTSVVVARELAAVIAANAPLAVQASKRLVHATRNMNGWGHEAWGLSEAEGAIIFSSRDALEGTSAFAEKRAPVWEGAQVPPAQL